MPLLVYSHAIQVEVHFLGYVAQNLAEMTNRTVFAPKNSVSVNCLKVTKHPESDSVEVSFQQGKRENFAIIDHLLDLPSPGQDFTGIFTPEKPMNEGPFYAKYMQKIQDLTSDLTSDLAMMLDFFEMFIDYF